MLVLAVMYLLIIAAEGANDEGLIGVAPDATFASLRIQFGLSGIEGGELQALIPILKSH